MVGLVLVRESHRLVFGVGVGGVVWGCMHREDFNGAGGKMKETVREVDYDHHLVRYAMRRSNDCER